MRQSIVKIIGARMRAPFQVGAWKRNDANADGFFAAALGVAGGLALAALPVGKGMPEWKQKSPDPDDPEWFSVEPLAWDLAVYMESDDGPGGAFRHLEAVRRNLWNRYRAGRYDHARASQAFLYPVETGA
ncbi:MAG: hypothetical protein ACE5FM_02590, partial [Methyloligellaceae bacterium]